MRISEFLSQSNAIVDVGAHHKSRLLTELCHRAASALKLDRERVSADIPTREELGSTGASGGIAIPHARLPDLKVPFGILARLQKAIDSNAIDGVSDRAVARLY